MVESQSLKKRMRIMLICVAILFGAIFAYKLFVSFMIKKFMTANMSPPVTVSAMKVEYQTWQPELSAVGNLRAVLGVDVTTEVAGLVRTIHFAPGAQVKKGDLLVELNADDDIAHLHSLQANAQLAEITYKRDKAQYAIKAISKATLDADLANLESLRAQVAQQAALVAKKMIHAPFTGKLGISNINPGQNINPGDKIVTLQALNPIYVDFYVPQQALTQIALGQQIVITTDSYPGHNFNGKITTIDPKFDPSTRNIQVEATVTNPNSQLLPGMFATVEITTGKPQRNLTLPQTAISYNPYGNIVYIIKKDNTKLIVTQRFVETGSTRGDQVSIVKGLQEGDQVVTSGQLKLKNGSAIIIDNSITLPNSPAPVVSDEHKG